MEIIITNPGNGRKYKIVPDSNGLCYQLWQTTMLKKGEVAKNGQTVKNKWQFTGKYPTSILDGLELVHRLMLSDPECKDKVKADIDDLSKLDSHIRSRLKAMAKSIETRIEEAS